MFRTPILLLILAITLSTLLGSPAAHAKWARETSSLDSRLSEDYRPGGSIDEQIASQHDRMHSDSTRADRVARRAGTRLIDQRADTRQTEPLPLSVELHWAQNPGLQAYLIEPVSGSASGTGTPLALNQPAPMLARYATATPAAGIYQLLLGGPALAAVRATCGKPASAFPKGELRLTRGRQTLRFAVDLTVLACAPSAASSSLLPVVSFRY